MICTPLHVGLVTCTQHLPGRIRFLFGDKNRFLFPPNGFSIGPNRNTWGNNQCLYISKSEKCPRTKVMLHIAPNMAPRNFYGGSCSVRRCCITGKNAILSILLTLWRDFSSISVPLRKFSGQSKRVYAAQNADPHFFLARVGWTRASLDARYSSFFERRRWFLCQNE